MAADAEHFEPSPNNLESVRLLVQRAASEAAAEVIADAEVVAVELVTNAWLHAHGGADVSVTVADDAVRIEVGDGARALPILRDESDDLVFGRGLRMVAALSRGWGARATDGGKTVWAEVAFDRTAVSPAGLVPDADAPLAVRNDRARTAERQPQDETTTVRVVGVPIGHLDHARAHIADVTREMHLLIAGEHVSGRPVPPVLAEALSALDVDWGDQTQALRRQLAEARERGDTEIDIEIELPVSRADAVERWRQALDLADALSRAGRLLTPAATPQQVAFLHWWLGCVAAQLRAAERGDARPRCRRFFDTLADDYDQLSVRAAAWDRLQLLQTVTGALTNAHTVSEVAQIVVDSAHEHLGAASARVYVLRDDTTLRSVAWKADAGLTLPDPYDEVRLDGDLPGALVARSRKPLVLRDLDEIYSTVPTLAGFYPNQRALLINPVMIGDRVIGLLGLTFPANSFDESAQVAFVQALADALAQALDRTQALAEADERAQRLRLLADASLALNASLDFQETVNALTQVLVPRVADWAVVEVVRDGRLQTASVHHPDPGKLAWARSLVGRWPTDMDAPRGGPAVLRTGRSEIYHDLAPDLIEAEAIDAEHLAALRALAMRSAVVVPLTGRSGPVGVVTLIYAESQRRYRDEDLPMVEDIARRAAFAIETAETFREQSGRLADVVRVADAAQRAILADVPSRVGPFQFAAAYRSSAVEATIGGDLFDVVPWRDGVRLFIGDVRGKGLAAIRTASLVLGAARAAAEDLPDLSNVMSSIDRRLRRHLSDEDFVTACAVELAPNGDYRLVVAGHPPPFVIRADGRVAQLDAPPSPPLGLGAAPEAVGGTLDVGDRLLLFTDALTEARDASRAFIPVERIVPRMAEGTLQAAVAETLRQLETEAGALDDDLALLAVEHNLVAPHPRHRPEDQAAVTDVDPAPTVGQVG